MTDAMTILAVDPATEIPAPAWTRPTGIHKALTAVMGEMGGIEKSETNREQNFKFRSIEAITAHVRPLFAKHEISIAPRVLDVESTEVTSKGGTKGYRAVATVHYTLTAASDASYITTQMIGEAIDYGDKSTSKAVQMAYKYMLTEVLAIGSGDDDPDAVSPDAGSTRKPKPRSKPKDPVIELKQRLDKKYGREIAKATWHTMFPDEQPTLKAEDVEAVWDSLESIVADAGHDDPSDPEETA